MSRGQLRQFPRAVYSHRHVINMCLTMRILRHYSEKNAITYSIYVQANHESVCSQNSPRPVKLSVARKTRHACVDCCFILRSFSFTLYNSLSPIHFIYFRSLHFFSSFIHHYAPICQYIIAIVDK